MYVNEHHSRLRRRALVELGRFEEARRLEGGLGTNPFAQDLAYVYERTTDERTAAAVAIRLAEESPGDLARARRHREILTMPAGEAISHLAELLSSPPCEHHDDAVQRVFVVGPTAVAALLSILEPDPDRWRREDWALAWVLAMTGADGVGAVLDEAILRLGEPSALEFGRDCWRVAQPTWRQLRAP